MHQTNTLDVNSLPNHTGTWTRVNRRKTTEKSTIDYIIISQSLKNKITHSATDTANNLIIKGENATDHNVITATIDMAMETKTQKTKTWKTGNAEQWKKYNNQIVETWKTTPEEEKNIPNLQNTMIKALEKNIGSKSREKNTKTKITNDEIQQTRKEKKELKTIFQQKCKNKQEAGKELNEYLNKQTELREQIEKHQRQELRKKINKIVEEGGAKSNTFWETRRRIINHNKEDNYDTKDENGNTISDPQKEKEHIAKYFENLYQAREGAPSHTAWTTHINDTVKDITRNPENTGNSYEKFNHEELDKTIRNLKRKKSTGPDNIPNEAFIEANQETRKIILEEMNKIQDHEEIPAIWQEGEIVRLYKGKGMKGKCSNERGITLSSNSGKVFERMINRRIESKINMTEAQAGGQKGKATTDHINTINTIIAYSKSRKKKTTPIHSIPRRNKGIRQSMVKCHPICNAQKRNPRQKLETNKKSEQQPNRENKDKSRTHKTNPNQR